MLLKEEIEYLNSFGNKFLKILEKKAVSEVQKKMFVYHINRYLKKSQHVQVEEKEETLGDLLGVSDPAGRELLFEEMRSGVLELFEALKIEVLIEGERVELALLFNQFCDKYKEKYLVEM